MEEQRGSQCSHDCFSKELINEDGAKRTRLYRHVVQTSCAVQRRAWAVMTSRFVFFLIEIQILHRHRHDDSHGPLQRSTQPKGAATCRVSEWCIIEEEGQISLLSPTHSKGTVTHRV